MYKVSAWILIFLCGLLTACGAEKKPQVIIPQAQLDALNKAKNLENDLLKMQQQQQEKLQEQGL